MHFSICDVFYTQNSQQHVSADISAILRVMLLYENTKIQKWLTVSPSLYVSYSRERDGGSRSQTVRSL